MTKLKVNQQIRDKIAQELKVAKAVKRVQEKISMEKKEVKERGDKLKFEREIELLNHQDKHYFESVEL